MDKKIIPFPTTKQNSEPKEKIILTNEEIEQFVQLQARLKTSRSPGEAQYFKNELDSLISLGRTKYHNTPQK